MNDTATLTRETVEQELLDAIHNALQSDNADDVRSRVLAYSEFLSVIRLK